VYRGDNITDSISIRLFSSINELNRYKEETYPNEDYAFVSTSTPLLSNLSMIENIALIMQVDERLSRKEAQKIAYDAMKPLGLISVAPLRYDVCSQKEIFYVQLIRAFVKKGAKIIIDQPFAFLAEENSINFILDALDALLIPYQQVMIIDLENQGSRYKEVSCHIEE